MRATTDPSRFVENAQQLLTRWWSTAGWVEREQLLKTVEWLIGLERLSSQLDPTAAERPAKRR
jgi:hypothetical protein